MTSQPSRGQPSQGRFAEARASLVESQLRPEGVIDTALLGAMGSLPRERFVPEGLAAIAYSDRAIPLARGRALMPPAALAQLIQALDPAPGANTLVVGAGTGYSAAVLGAMGAKVTAVECDPALAETARANGVEATEGPLETAFAAGAPFDLILIDGAVDGEVPEAIIAQLRDGGRLATGVVENGVGRLAIGTRAGTAFGLRTFADAAVSVLPGFAQVRSFTF
jgi:protein-L-isoaspartate(D-aspartate) O-methyltransferase